MTAFDDLSPLLQRRYCLLSLVVGACIYLIAGSFQVVLTVPHILPYSDKLLNQRLTILLHVSCTCAASIHDSSCLISSAFVTRILCRSCLESKPLALASKSLIFVKCDGKKKFLRALADVDN
jgi:hypothetical protein